MEASNSSFIINLEEEYEKSEHKTLNLSQWIERYFVRFGYKFSFSRDSIVSNPAESIDSGLQKLCAAGDISDDEYSEHIQQYNWGEKNLGTLLNDPTCVEQLLALIRNLDYWYCKRQENAVGAEE